MLARIFCPAKTSMQSGRARAKAWVLEFEPASARKQDPLMGWNSSSDMNAQVQLNFETSDEAVAYARAHGIDFQLTPESKRSHIVKAYADNFAFQRREPWTH